MIHESLNRLSLMTVDTRRGAGRLPTFGSTDILRTQATTAVSPPVIEMLGPMISILYDRYCEKLRVSSPAGADGHSLVTADASSFS